MKSSGFVDIDKGYPRVFVIIPCYNCASYLEKTVDSINRQNGDLLIYTILVDDGSKDATAQICDSLQKSAERVYVIHKTNGGVSSARNAGIQYVLNQFQIGDKDYFAFLDADDAWREGFFDRDTCQLLNKHFDLIGFQSCSCNAKMTKREESVPMQEGAFQGGRSAIWLYSKQSFGAMLYSCRFLSRYDLLFDENIRYAEDKVFTMQCLYLADQFFLKNSILYYYRIRNDSTIRTRDYGIPYYSSILDAYLDSDKKMHAFYSEERGLLNEGTRLVSFYLMDMVREHFRFFRSRAEIDRLFVERTQWNDLLLGKNKLFPYQNKEYIEYLTNPSRFILKENIHGIISFLIRSIKKVRISWALYYLSKYRIAIQDDVEKKESIIPHP